jgi:hypothetical protein
MAIVRVSGTRQFTTNGSNVIGASNGAVVVESSQTVVAGAISVTGNPSISFVSSGSIYQFSGTNATLVPGQVVVPNSIVIQKDNTLNVGNPTGLLYNPGDTYPLSSDPTEGFYERTQAALYVPGGVGIEKDLNVGGFIYGRISKSTTSSELIIPPVNNDLTYYIPFTQSLSTVSGGVLFGDNVGLSGNSGPYNGLTYNPYTGKLSTDQVHINASTSGTTTATLVNNALYVAGGAGVTGDITLGGNINALTNIAQSIGSSTTNFMSAYMDKIYSNLITTNKGQLDIAPQGGGINGYPTTQITGDIRVQGKNPIGTAPVVTNVLYVTMDGDDTNDGRAMDPSRACRTIGAALNSPYYQPGTQIRVSPGHYLENNPLRLKPYTTIMGSDLRTTSVEPINKTQDLFHVESGCYLAFMQMTNGRSGLLDGQYAPGYNRGAYAVSFPPLTGSDRIDLFHSPYVQNCTNQSGPWLKDGTMFVPDYTVQVPAAVGMGSWEANTTSIVVSISTGTIAEGMSINAGQQNPGFFNARTLMLANKPFMQEQVTAYINQTFNSGSFTYNSAKCERDTGIIIDSIVEDMLYDTTSESIFAGIQYYSQNGYTGQIPSEITGTITAIGFIKSRAVSAVTSVDVGLASIVSADFDVILNILNNGTTGVTDTIISNGLPNTASNYVSSYNTLINNIDTITSATITYIADNNLVTGFTYDQAKCSRDTGLIVDALALDLLFGGHSQSTFAGIQYWNQDGLVGQVSTELAQTIDAINFASALAQQVITNTTGSNYSTGVQITNLPAGTSIQQTIVSNDFSVITNILNVGTTGVTDTIVPNGITASNSQDVINSYNLLQANKEFIQGEVIAYINYNVANNIAPYSSSFVYTTATCYRDVGYIIDSVSFDLLYPNAAGPANKQAVQSGVYYYGYTGTTSIPNEIPQTTAAYNHLKDIVYNIIQCNTVTNVYQNSVAQVTNITPGSAENAINAQRDIDVITNIISNGPSVVTAKTPIGLIGVNDPNAVHAAAALEANRAFIQAEIIAYINATFGLGYDVDTCKRDIKYIIESVAFDLLNPNTTAGYSNKQAIKAGVYYYNYGSGTTVIPNEIPQTTAVYNFIKSIIPNIVTAVPITNSYQDVVTQVLPTNINNLSTATIHEATTLQNNIDIITGIIRNGPSAVTAKIPMGTTSTYAGGNQEVINAYKLLEANKSYIVAEVTAYIDSQFNYFTFNQAKSFRDTGILIENVAYDATFGGNEKSREAGLAYWNGVVSVIGGQQTQCISAIDYLNQLCQLVVNNETAPDLLSGGGLYSQVINTALTGGGIISNSLTDRFNIITNLIANGPSVAPALYKATGPDAAFASAEILLQANRTFIQENVINYINYNLTDKTFPYNHIKCRRDTGLIVDAIALDMLYPTTNYSQSTFAALQYYSQGSYTGQISNEINQTIDAIKYLKELSVKVVQNITTATDAIVGVYRYQNTVQQVLGNNIATSAEVATIQSEFDTVLTILGGDNIGWTDRIITNGLASTLPAVQNTVNLLEANKAYLVAEIIAYVTATNAGFVFNTATCERDVGYILDSISFDLIHGGNKQAVQSGLYYYGVNASTSSIHGQETQTARALARIASIIPQLLLNEPVAVTTGTTVKQVTSLPAASTDQLIPITAAINTMTNIIVNGPGVAPPKSPISLIPSTIPLSENAYNILKANQDFIADEVINYIEWYYNPTSFKYNEELCYRDTGLIIDAVSQDILLGGNSKSIEAGLAYWNQGYNYVAGQETTTTMAINYARDLALQVAANTPVASITGTIATQVINPFFEYGGDYMPQQAIARNFDIITTIISKGPVFAPPVYQGGGISLATGALADDVRLAPKITSVTSLGGDSYLLGLSTSTIGFGTDATLYFGDTYVIPKQDYEVDALSYELTGNTGTWAIRKLDPIGSMGGSLVDGAVISDRSPIQSFVYDAFTQVTQGGRGIHITNNGYAQLVSVFTIFCSVGVQVDNGGIASIVNSNDNFGDICLLAKGYGTRAFSGTIYNPPFKAYPDSPGIDGLNQYYPNGFWPNSAQVEVFVPDTANRPHISLVMEIVPPLGHVNEQGLPGFLNAPPNTGTLTTGTITIQGVDTSGIAIGNTLYVRDQFGSQYDSNGVLYVATGTIVTDLGFQSITLNQPLTSGGFDPTYGPANNNYFNLYFCGNAYYTVLSSTVASNPTVVGTNILSTANGVAVDETNACVSALRYLGTLTNYVVSNIAIPTGDLYQKNPGFTGTTYTQVTNSLVSGGSGSTTFIDLEFNTLLNIIGAPNITSAQNVIPSKLITTSGAIPAGAGSAITLIQNNFDFLATEVEAYIQINFPNVYADQPKVDGITVQANEDYKPSKSYRDVLVTLQRLIYDLETGGNYNAVYSGLSYWSRDGTHHIVQLGENVTRNDLFPDGATVNFYQRSYISASGYVFEYVGAGTNYGALPQVGHADPVQGKETVQLDSGKVFFTSTDQNGDFRIGPDLVISQATGVISGRTFTKSLFANLTPFILAIESI